MARFWLVFSFAASLLSTIVGAALPPDEIEVFQAIQKPAPLPGTNLTASNNKIIFRVPGTDTTIHLSNYGKLLSQTEVSLCLLEGMSDLFAAAVKNKGDGSLTSDKFQKSYGKATVEVQSYHPPVFRLTTGVGVDILRGIGLFMSLYGWFQVNLDIYDRTTGHIGVGQVL
ncbi:MAG: hypothetical protein Q9201_003327 [Fulgogasparrea decipioides]